MAKVKKTFNLKVPQTYTVKRGNTTVEKTRWVLVGKGYATKQGMIRCWLESLPHPLAAWDGQLYVMPTKKGQG